MRLNSLFAKTAVLGGLGLLAAGAVQAAPLNLNLIGGAPTGPVGGQFTFNFGVDLAETEGLRTGDFFTIFDFAGFTGTSSFTSGTAAVVGTDFSVAFVAGTGLPGSGGNIGVPTDNTDDPNIRNLVVTFIGATTISGAAGNAMGVDFTFSANSTFGGVATDSFNAKAGDLSSGGNLFSGGNLGVAAAVIPEPGTMALLATGVLPLAGAVIRRRRSK